MRRPSRHVTADDQKESTDSADRDSDKSPPPPARTPIARRPVWLAISVIAFAIWIVVLIALAISAS